MMAKTICRHRAKDSNKDVNSRLAPGYEQSIFFGTTIAAVCDAHMHKWAV